MASTWIICHLNTEESVVTSDDVGVARLHRSRRVQGLTRKARDPTSMACVGLAGFDRNSKSLLLIMELGGYKRDRAPSLGLGYPTHDRLMDAIDSL